MEYMRLLLTKALLLTKLPSKRKKNWVGKCIIHFQVLILCQSRQSCINDLWGSKITFGFWPLFSVGEVFVWFPWVVFGSITKPSHFELHRGASLAIAPVFKDRVYKDLSSREILIRWHRSYCTRVFSAFKNVTKVFWLKTLNCKFNTVQYSTVYCSTVWPFQLEVSCLI